MFYFETHRDIYLNDVIVLRTHEWTAQKYVTNSWGYGVSLISRHGIVCRAPLF